MFGEMAVNMAADGISWVGSVNYNCGLGFSEKSKSLKWKLFFSCLKYLYN
jgi:hypothetical protein